MPTLGPLVFALLLAAAPAVAQEPARHGLTPVAPAFSPLPMPQLMATAASPDVESAERALSQLLSHDSPDRALLRLLTAGTTQDARIALHFVERPTHDAMPALLRALDRHEDGTRDALAVLNALRACVPPDAYPPMSVDGEEDPTAWREWAQTHRRTTAVSRLGRVSLSVLPLVWMLAAGHRREH